MMMLMLVMLLLLLFRLYDIILICIGARTHKVNTVWNCRI